jgi:hypothetical protein
MEKRRKAEIDTRMIVQWDTLNEPINTSGAIYSSLYSTVLSRENSPYPPYYHYYILLLPESVVSPKLLQDAVRASDKI